MTNVLQKYQSKLNFYKTAFASEGFARAMPLDSARGFSLDLHYRARHWRMPTTYFTTTPLEIRTVKFLFRRQELYVWTCLMQVFQPQISFCVVLLTWSLLALNCSYVCYTCIHSKPLQVLEQWYTVFHDSFLPLKNKTAIQCFSGSIHCKYCGLLK